MFPTEKYLIIMLEISGNNTAAMYGRSIRLLATKSSFTPLSNASINVEKSFPQFAVGLDNGFLPRTDPLQILPKEFSVLDSLLKRMVNAMHTPGFISKL